MVYPRSRPLQGHLATVDGVELRVKPNGFFQLGAIERVAPFLTHPLISSAKCASPHRNNCRIKKKNRFSVFFPFGFEVFDESLGRGYELVRS